MVPNANRIRRRKPDFCAAQLVGPVVVSVRSGKVGFPILSVGPKIVISATVWLQSDRVDVRR